MVPDKKAKMTNFDFAGGIQTWLSMQGGPHSKRYNCMGAYSSVKKRQPAMQAMDTLIGQRDNKKQLVELFMNNKYLNDQVQQNSTD